MKTNLQALNALEKALPLFKEINKNPALWWLPYTYEKGAINEYRVIIDKVKSLKRSREFQVIIQGLAMSAVISAIIMATSIVKPPLFWLMIFTIGFTQLLCQLTFGSLFRNRYNELIDAWIAQNWSTRQFFTDVEALINALQPSLTTLGNDRWMWLLYANEYEVEDKVVPFRVKSDCEEWLIKKMKAVKSYEIDGPRHSINATTTRMKIDIRDHFELFQRYKIIPANHTQSHYWSMVEDMLKQREQLAKSTSPATA